MALTADQRAMLQLLLERDQSYDDLASVLGTSREEVRRRARAALAELGGEDPDTEVALTDFLLGEADPIGRADAVRHLQADPEALRLAQRLSTKLQLLAPEAELPELPHPRRRKEGPDRSLAARLPRPRRASPTAQAPRLSQRQARILVALGASAVILIAIVLAVAGVFGGEEPSTQATTDASAGAGEELTRVQLQPQGGSEASGQAVFGLATDDQPYLDVDIQGLEPPPEGGTYVIWFLLTEDRGYPLAPIAPSVSGAVDDRFAIPQVILPIAVRTRFVDISLVDNRQLAGDLQKAIQGANVLLRYRGESVLRGAIPELERQGGGGGA